MIDLQIIPECYIDTKLCKILVPPTTRYNHQKGCPNVVKVMREKLSDDFALGIVDKDKLELSYFREFGLITEIPESLQLFKHKARNHYLIFIRPVMEKWIIACANEAGILLGSFGLPHNFQELSRITKTSKSENEDANSGNFKMLFEELKSSESASIRTLSLWISYLRHNPYNADIDHIRAETIAILNGKR